MRPRFPDYKSYAEATLKEIFTEEELKRATQLTANYLRTAYFEQGANGQFQEKPLPVETQFAPVCTLAALDYDQDGLPDLLVGGNVNQARLRFGKSDANYGQLFKGDGKGHFTYIPQGQSGFQLKGDVRSILLIDKTILIGINQQPVKAYRLAKSQEMPKASYANRP